MYRILLPLVLLSTILAPGVPSARAQQPQIGGAAPANPSSSALVLARVKYSGGGDWYNDQEADVNMLEYLRSNTSVNVRPQFEYVELTSDNIFNYPILFLTGHGNIDFSPAEARRLRAYLDNGGFLYIDDDYGLDTAVRREMRKVFPEQEMRELPFDHPLYHSYYEFPNGLPKIHEHDAKPPQGYGLFTDGNRLCVYYTTETNPSDGWADASVHNNPPEKREAAFRIGTNIVVYALTR
ncbi:MAG TPA: DUF4159 domain-containing protein [Candidatus Kapabacteria bacterium]|nr:DUF4159 domain-containing protein [Candidatus Kapabacteria bacterium]